MDKKDLGLLQYIDDIIPLQSIDIPMVGVELLMTIFFPQWEFELW